jgi:5'-nucleotidase
MRILISNDDGISAKGIQILEKVAREFSDDVWVVAPELDQSGASHALTLRDPFRIREVSSKKFAISGTPSDCVMTAMCLLMKDKKPDLVLSGVNNGGNLAEDIIYSGTVAAAIEASILQIPAVAFSLVIENQREPQWDMVEHYAQKVIEKILPMQLRDQIILNVNFPNVSIESVRGIWVTSQGRRVINNDVVKGIDPRGHPYYWIGSADYRMSDIWEHVSPGSDLESIANKAISVTPISLNLTHTPTQALLREALHVS